MLESARGGNADAQFHLGHYYHDGIGVIRDDLQAYEWIHRSVEYGVSHERLLDALLYLGAAREWGRGMRQDLTEAYKWFTLASNFSRDAQNTHEEVSRALGALQIRMNAREVALANERAQSWLNSKAEMYAAN
jgi:hypothetical protein